MSDLTLPMQSSFDEMQRPDGMWSARDLMPSLGYGADWRNFESVIDRARATAENQGYRFEDLFVGVTEKSGGRPRFDYSMTRFACYLVAMNGDPRKPEIAAAQSYFAIKTREAEVATPPALTPAEQMARGLVAAQELLTAKDERIAELEPKADLADTYLTSQGGARLVREVAKTLGMKQVELRRFLLDEDLIFVKHAPCGDVMYDFRAQFAHHFQARETVVNHTWGTCSHYTLQVLPRGVELIVKRLRDTGHLGGVA
ncbi:phage antirepressor KilAC domain-containing protein [Rhodococcoides fascians]|uniref:phage antirepressor KilAC domain-containing protein n=1 Tax=Rhodococcoides fascians TaxID=1828 RepID=UPI00068A53C7|nr:phage antirepressor KilAC domain-containing protein [Rhodococcus fascians]